jgi:hypothetical protein
VKQGAPGTPRTSGDIAVEITEKLLRVYDSGDRHLGLQGLLDDYERAKVREGTNTPEPGRKKWVSK